MPMYQEREEERLKERSKKNNKKPKTENKRTSGIFVGYCEELPEMNVLEEQGRKSSEVASNESVKEVEIMLWQHAVRKVSGGHQRDVLVVKGTNLTNLLINSVCLHL